jgi:hypothetical protein
MNEPVEQGPERETTPHSEVEAAPASLEVSSTGVRAADAALERLRDVETAPLEEHVEIFDDVQRRLHEGLAELDDEQ